MKKYVVCLIVALVAGMFTACSSPKANEASQSTPPPPSAAEVEGAGADESEMREAESVPEETPSSSGDEAAIRLHVADAAIYRGTLQSITEAEDGKILLLQQAQGTDFGAPSASFVLKADTKTSFREEDLKEGAYVEVFYGMAPGATLDGTQQTDAVAINVYFETAMTNFNGILKEVFPDPDKEGAGQLVMEDLANGEEVVFNFDSEHTQFYLTFTDLKPGDKLNIFHRGMYTMSLPPQGSAMEVRLYAE